MIDNTMSKEKKIYTAKAMFLVILIIVDFLLTHLGINVLNLFTERNPFMIFLFELTFVQGLIIRIILAMFVFLLIMFIYKYKHYRKVINLLIIINMIPFFAHIYWASYYYFFVYYT